MSFWAKTITKLTCKLELSLFQLTTSTAIKLFWCNKTNLLSKFVSYEGYAQFVKDVQLYGDDFKLRSDFMLPSESLIVGNT